MSNEGELAGSEFLLRLLHKPPPRHHSDPPLICQSNGPDHLVPRGNQTNPNSTLSDSFQNLGIYHREDNLQFNRFADDSFYNTSVKNPRENSLVLNGNEANLRDSMGSSSGERNTYAPHFRNSLNYSREGSDNIQSVNNTSEEEIARLNGFEAFRNSPNLISERNSLVLNGYRPNSRDSMGSISGERNTYAPRYHSSLNYSREGSDSISRVNLSNLNNGGNSRVSNGYEASYGNSSNLGRVGVGYDRPNRALNGLESNYRNSSNLGSVGEGYDRPSRVLNGSESNYRNFPNLERIGEEYDRPNRVLNGFEADYRNSMNLSIIREGRDRPNRALNGFNAGYQNSPDSSVIGEGHRPSSWFNSDFPNFRNSDKEQGNISRTGIARQEIKHTPPGFSNKANNRVGGNNVESSSSGLRNWSIKFEDERGKGEPPTGSALDSVSGFGIEESLSESHNEIGEKAKDFVVGDVSLGNSNDFVKDLDTLDEEDGSSEKNQKRRDKDYRSDTRGQRVLAQWMRRNKRMIQCRNDINMFNAPLLAIFDSLVPPEEEKMKQKQLLAFLERLVVKEWPEARLLVYGSCANSFGVKKSDIDICLAMKDPNVNKSKILSKLADILIEENLENVQALTHARVPIVKLMDPVTQISCDICCNNVLAVVNSKLLRDYAKIDGRLRQLAFIVKHWAKLRGVNETYHGTLSSYAYVLMCIHFLQQCRPAILPCLQGMDTTYKAVVENVECAFFDQVEKLDGFGLRNMENIGQLLWGFFRYWAYCHDYTHDVVSVRVGSIISKQAKDWTRRVGNDRHLICIEDPFDITHDLGRVVDKFSIKVLREEFERAAQILQYDPNPCVTLFEPYVRS